MFARLLHVTYHGEHTSETAVPLAWLDSFAMRNFTNSAAFDDLLPRGAGQLEAGYRVPLPALAAAMEAWFRRKGWLPAQASVRVSEGGTEAGFPDSAAPYSGAS